MTKKYSKVDKESGGDGVGGGGYLRIVIYKNFLESPEIYIYLNFKLFHSHSRQTSDQIYKILNENRKTNPKLKHFKYAGKILISNIDVKVETLENYIMYK